MAKTKVTVKEAKLVKAIANGANQTEAGLAADPNRGAETARVWANQTLQKPTVQEALHAEMAKQGITLEAIVKPIKDGLTADKPGYTDKEGVYQEGGKDHSIRLKASGMAAQFMGIGKQATVEGGIHFHQHVEEKKGDYEF